jgi:hypothetical protein
MATLAGVFNMSHSPFCYSAPEHWNDVRASRSLRADVPLDDVETNRAKAARVAAAFATLRARLAAAAPDVIVIFGDDQLECFDFRNYPAFAIYAGEKFHGALAGGGSAGVPGHPTLATALLTGLLRRGFDPAFSLDMPKPDRGIGHAFLRPAESLTDFTTPIVPVLLNCYYAPQPTAARCYQLGIAVREIIDAQAGDLRVAVVGSGGLWHTPGKKDAWLNTDFDETTLKLLEAGDIKGMAEHFDSYVIPPDDESQNTSQRSRNVTGMPSPGGPAGGTRETCAWIAAAAVSDGCPTTIVDYVEVWASPVGNAFAYCDRIC